MTKRGAATTKGTKGTKGTTRTATLAASLLLAACHAAPATPPAPKAHHTIVSLNPCSDAILAEVAAPGQLLAISHYSHDPASSSMDLATAHRFVSTGGTVEEIAALAPDLVVAGGFLPTETAQGLERLGIRTETLPIPATLAQSEAQVRQLARLAGNEPAGEALVARIEAAVMRAAPPQGEAPLPALVWESGGIVAGNGTLITDLLAHAGFVNAAAARGLSQAAYLPLERVLADPPRVIFAVGNPASEEDRSLRHPALRGLTGTTRAPLDGALLWCGGPTIPRALERLAAVRKRLPSSSGEGPGVGALVPARRDRPTPTPTPPLKGRG